ncbi:hypothetical protein [Xenorhabdus hominickii]|nr:hypothetical protein [Xenorhabdus hominickii]AOM41006.1 hypothetical protein A9255_10710 [Xenorhabdus hominickii]
MSIKTNTLAAPSLPQSKEGIIDESELSQPILVVKIKRYEPVNIDDYIIVNLKGDVNVSSEPFYIIEENIHFPHYEIIIPFSHIPLGSYDVYYAVTDRNKNTTLSATEHVTIKHSYFSPCEASLTITGYQPIGDEYEILTIQIHDKQTSEQIKNTAVFYKIERAVNISNVLEIGSNPDTIQSMTTDEYGQFKINLQGQKGRYCTIRVTTDKYVGSIKYTMGQF